MPPNTPQKITIYPWKCRFSVLEMGQPFLVDASFSTSCFPSARRPDPHSRRQSAASCALQQCECFPCLTPRSFTQQQQLLSPHCCPGPSSPSSGQPALVEAQRLPSAGRMFSLVGQRENWTQRLETCCFRIVAEWSWARSLPTLSLSLFTCEIVAGIGSLEELFSLCALRLLCLIRTLAASIVHFSTPQQCFEAGLVIPILQLRKARL